MERFLFSRLRGAFVFVIAMAAASAPAQAIPIFAQRYHLQCGACHSVMPELNSFGNYCSACTATKLVARAVRKHPDDDVRDSLSDELRAGSGGRNAALDSRRHHSLGNADLGNISRRSCIIVWARAAARPLLYLGFPHRL